MKLCTKSTYESPSDSRWALTNQDNYLVSVTNRELFEFGMKSSEYLGAFCEINLENYTFRTLIPDVISRYKEEGLERLKVERYPKYKFMKDVLNQIEADFLKLENDAVLEYRGMDGDRFNIIVPVNCEVPNFIKAFEVII